MVYFLKAVSLFVYMPFLMLIGLVTLIDQISTNAYVIYLGSNPISWSSKKQHLVAWSSTNEEYRAVASVAVKLEWVESLLFEFNILSSKHPYFFCDNVFTTYLYANPIFHSCMKHIAINFHFVCDKVTIGQLCVAYVSTNDQLVDALTKPLSYQRLTFLYSKIGVPNETTILLGYIS